MTESIKAAEPEPLDLKVARVRKRIAEIDGHVKLYPSWEGGSTQQHAQDCDALLTRLEQAEGGLREALREADIQAMTDAERGQVFAWIMRCVGRRPRKGKWVSRLSALQIGDSFLTTDPNFNWGNICTAKISARRRLDEPKAQWSGRTTNQGVRITRIK